MERTPIVPHLSWSGPQPDREMDAYLLAMLLRIHASGLDDEHESKRDSLQTPSVLTTKNLHMIAIMYAFYREKMEESGTRNIEDMLKLIKSLSDEKVGEWVSRNVEAVRKAETELIEFVDTPESNGFRCFG